MSHWIRLCPAHQARWGVLHRGIRQFAALTVALGTAGCHQPLQSAPVAAPERSAVRFVEAARDLGIDFRHNNGARGKKYMPESVGSGCAFVDYDNDGDQDLLFVDGVDWPGTPPDSSLRGTLRLYRNDGASRFSDVTRASGLMVDTYGMGVAIADYDNDGDQDIYLTALGANHLFRNRVADSDGAGGAVFEDVTSETGLAGYPIPDEGMGLRWKWSASAAWLDYDRDGRLDLFVTNYVKWSPETDVWCGKAGKPKSYCAPGSYVGFPCALYRNEGSRFRDVSVEMGIRSPQLAGKSFGVAVADYNGDGWPDLAVSNDTWPNFLFLNEGGKRYVERGVEAGIAHGEDGKAKAGMGIDTADWNNSGKFGLLIGNFSSEGLSLWENEGNGFFVDRAHEAGLSAPSLLFLTFGVCFFDYDLDGWQDALTANGHIDDFVRSYDSMLSYRERPLLFKNRGTGSFTEVGQTCGLDQELVARGAAYGDLEGDGDLDFAMVSNGERAYVYRNEGGNASAWIRLRMEGVQSNRDGIGALVRVTQGRLTQSQYVRSGGSFLSESQRELTFGLGSARRADQIEVLWPSGRLERVGPLPAGQSYLLREGAGAQPEPRGKIKEARDGE